MEFLVSTTNLASCSRWRDFKSRQRLQVGAKLIIYCMRHSNTEILIHASWTTLYQQALIEPYLQSFIHCFLRFQFAKLQCPALLINGDSSHVHCLFQLSQTKSLSQVMKQVKGSSSFLFNKYNLSPIKFHWEKGFKAYSFASSELNVIITQLKLQSSLVELNS